MPVQKPGRCATLSFSSPHPQPLVSPQAIVAITIFITFSFVITLRYIVASGSLILNDIANHGSFSTPHTSPIFMCVVCNLAPCRVSRTTGHTCTWPVMLARSLQLHSRNVCLCCHDPSHGGFYMAEGALYIRIGLPPRVVSGDCLVSSRYGLTARSFHCRRAYPMSRDWGCTSTCCRSLYVPISSMRPWGLYLHSHVRPLSW